MDNDVSCGTLSSFIGALTQNQLLVYLHNSKRNQNVENILIFPKSFYIPQGISNNYMISL